MKKISVLLSVVMLVSVLSSGCGSKKAESAAPAANDDGKPVVLKAVTVNPKESGHYRGLEIYKKLVEERTKGRVKVELYSDGVLGDEEQMAEGVKMGTVDVMMISSAKYANFVPETDIYSPPYTFNSWDHMKAVLNSDVDKKIAEAVKQRRGDIYLGVFTDGLRNVFTRTEKKTIDDLKGIKLRTMTGPNEIASWKAFGTNPTPLAYTEVYAALQAGVVDGAENTMTSIYSMKFYESCKFVLRTGHCYLTLPFFMGAKALEKVPADLRDTVIQAGKDTCTQQIDMAIKLDQDNEEVLKSKYGVKINELSADDKAKAIELTKPVLQENAKKLKMEKELEQIVEMGKKFK